MAFDNYVALSAFRAGGRDYVRGEPVDDEMENFFILTDLTTKLASPRVTPAGQAAVADYEASPLSIVRRFQQRYRELHGEAQAPGGEDEETDETGADEAPGPIDDPSEIPPGLSDEERTSFLMERGVSEEFMANAGGSPEDEEEEVATQQNIDASPAAIKRAEELGVNPAEIQGSGSGGKVTVADVHKAAQG